jgi:hypothetical protein
MSTDELECRQARAHTETFVIAKTAEGFRVCTPLNPATQYVVSGTSDAARCTCPDYTKHETDPDWRCKHILAVLPQLPAATAGAETQSPQEAAVPPVKAQEPHGRKAAPNGTAQMLLKRSVSPDKRIDSLSVEFLCPLGTSSAEAVKGCAEATLQLQSEIVAGFLKQNTVKVGEQPVRPVQPNGALPAQTNGALPARLLKVEGMPTRYGRRLFIAVETNGKVLKLFGSQQQLADALKTAGYGNLADRLAEGTELNLPCRITTKQSDDGRYTNVGQVMPAGAP